MTLCKHSNKIKPNKAYLKFYYSINVRLEANFIMFKKVDMYHELKTMLILTTSETLPEGKCALYNLQSLTAFNSQQARKNY